MRDIAVSTARRSMAQHGAARRIVSTWEAARVAAGWEAASGKEGARDWGTAEGWPESGRLGAEQTWAARCYRTAPQG